MSKFGQAAACSYHFKSASHFIDLCGSPLLKNVCFIHVFTWTTLKISESKCSVLVQRKQCVLPLGFTQCVCEWTVDLVQGGVAFTVYPVLSQIIYYTQHLDS